MFAVQADEKLKVKRTPPVNVQKRFFSACSTADQKIFGSKLFHPSKMAEGGEETLVENGKLEDEVELDLAKCAEEFAQYCQVDVRKEV